MNEIAKVFSSLLLLGTGFVGASLLGPPDLVDRFVSEWSPPAVEDSQSLRPLPVGTPALPAPLLAGHAKSLPQAASMLSRAPGPAIAQATPAAWNAKLDAPEDNWLDLSQPFEAKTPQASVATPGEASNPDAWGVPNWTAQTASNPATVEPLRAPQWAEPQLEAPVAAVSQAPKPIRETTSWGDYQTAMEPSPFARNELPAVRPIEPTAGPERTHVVTDGDTLPMLAQRYLGDSTRAEELYQLNQDRLTHPDLLPIGIVLRTPSAPQHAPAPEPHTSAWRGATPTGNFATVSSPSSAGHDRPSRLTPIGHVQEPSAAPAPDSHYLKDWTW